MHESGHPVVDPELPRLWRNKNTVQFGLSPKRSIIVSGLDPVIASVLKRIDGTRSHAALRLEATTRGGVAETVDCLLDLLDSADALLSTPDRDTERLRDAWVSVQGAGAIGSTIASLLVAVGVAHVDITDPDPVRACDVAVGGAGRSDLGVPREIVAGARLRDLAVQTPRSGMAARPDLVVLAPAIGFARRLSQRATQQGAPHLVVTHHGDLATVGPLVTPGQSACQRCIDLTHADHDPDWPALIAQLESSAGHPGDPLLTVAAALLAAEQIRTWLLTGNCAVVGATIEMSSPIQPETVRRWSVHPECGCTWDGRIPREQPQW